MAIALSLSACAGASDKYPSLSIREFERTSQTAIESPPAPSPAPDASLAANLDAMVQQAELAHSRFMNALPKTRSTVIAARGTSPEMKIWGDAEIALASLQTMRGETALVLADIDLQFAQANSELDHRNSARIGSAQTQVAALLAEQDQALASLGASQ